MGQTRHVHPRDLAPRHPAAPPEPSTDHADKLRDELDQNKKNSQEADQLEEQGVYTGLS